MVETVTSPQQNKVKADRRAYFREIVDLILPDSLMIFLAIVMIPLILVPVFVNIPAGLNSFFIYSDYFVLGVFVIEYMAKALLAPSIIKHVLNPWRILDFFIVIISIVSVLPLLNSKFGFYPLLLRLIRIVRVAALGSRTVDRRIQMKSVSARYIQKEVLPISVRVMDNRLENTYINVTLDKMKEYLGDPSQTWVDISGVSEVHLDRLSEILGIPRIILESELSEESYPRVDYFEHFAMIFTRIADVITERSEPEQFYVKRNGILVICCGQNIITLSRTGSNIFDLILQRAKKVHSAEEPLIVSILYTILKFILEQDKQIARVLETELMKLESVPSNKRPPGFLETAFQFRKEVNQLVPSLLHLKEIIDMITSRRLPLEGFGEKHVKIFDMLLDETVYLYDTASDARDDLQSLVDLYINTTSYQMNRVMRVIAVLSSLSILPGILGLLGSNILGNPWDIQLWQVFALLGVVMATMIWIFFRMGWLKG